MFLILFFLPRLKYETLNFQVTEAFNPTLEDYSKFSPHALAHWCKAMKRYPLHDINSILEVSIVTQ